MITPFQVAYKNLLRKKMRTLLTLVGIMLASWVLVSLFGFNRGYENALNRDIDNMRYQLMVMAKGCPYEAATLMLQGGRGCATSISPWCADREGSRGRVHHPDPDAGGSSTPTRVRAGGSRGQAR